MNTPATLPFETDEYSRYMLRAPVEIHALLRSLGERVAQMTVFFNEGQDMLITTLAEVGDHVVLDFGPDAAANRKALEAKKHFCVTTLDKVRVQFILRDFAQTSFAGRPAFRAELPGEVLRLQRREYYRLVTPVLQPLICHMPLALADGRAFRHDAQVFDISCGGVGVAAPPEQMPFGTDMTFTDCRIELPEVGAITSALRVRSVFEILLRSGARVRRAGCEFIGLRGTMMTLIQRYIIRVERERKARQSGLG